MFTQQENADALVEAFEMFDSWEDRYRFLIDLGRKLPALPDDARTEENRVHGCQSQVWLVAEAKDDDTITFVADSDSTLVKGLIAVLRKMYSGQKARDVLSFDIEGLLERLGLNQHLSMSRRNGLFGMVKKIKTIAARQSVEHNVA
jgi:sulfur transfer protein SufE